jgi:DnaJ-class molecular chaperone
MTLIVRSVLRTRGPKVSGEGACSRCEGYGAVPIMTQADPVCEPCPACKGTGAKQVEEGGSS